MVGKTTVFLSLLFALLPLPPAAAGGAEAAALGLGMHGGLALADDPLGLPEDFYTPKAQAVGGLTALVDIPLASSLSLGLGVRLHGAAASSLSGGWSYRSHWGGALRLSAGYGWGLSDPSGPLQLELGASAGASINFDLYTWTTLFFFYPGVFLEPYLEFRHPRLGRHSFTLVLPLDYYFRRDLELYGSIGLGVVWKVYLKGRS